MTVGTILLLVLTAISAISAVYRHRRFKGTLRSSIPVILGCLLSGAAILAIGPAFVEYVRAETAATRSGGWSYQFQSNPLLMVNFYLWIVLIPGILLSSLLILFGFSARSGRLFFLTIISVLWLGAVFVDIVFIFLGGDQNRLPTRSFSDVFYALVLNAIGATIGALVMWWLWRKVTLRGTGGLSQSTVSQDLTTLIRKSLIVPALLVSFYFIHIYRIPTHVAFVSDDWRGVDFIQYGGPFSQLRLRNTKEDEHVVLYGHSERISLYAARYDHLRALSVSIPEEVQDKKIKLGQARFRQIPFRNYSEYNDRLVDRTGPDPADVAEFSGTLELTLPTYVNLVEIAAPQNGITPTLTLNVPYGARVSLERNRGSPPIWRELLGKQEKSSIWISVWHPSLGVEVNVKDRFSFGLVRVHPLIRWPDQTATAGEMRQFCKSPGSLKTDTLTSDLQFCGNQKIAEDGFVNQIVIPVIGSSSAEAKIKITGVQEIKLEEGKFAFRIVAGIQSKVGDLTLKWSKGKLHTGTTEREVRDTDFIFVGGHNLLLSDRDAGQFDLIGQSSYILVNGTLINKTIFAYFSNEFYSALFGALFAFAFVNFRKMVRLIEKI